MESDSALHADVPDGAEVLPSPLEENQTGGTVDASDSNLSSNEVAGPAEETGNLYLFKAML